MFGNSHIGFNSVLSAEASQSFLAEPALWFMAAKNGLFRFSCHALYWISSYAITRMDLEPLHCCFLPARHVCVQTYADMRIMISLPCCAPFRCSAMFFSRKRFAGEKGAVLLPFDFRMDRVLLCFDVLWAMHVFLQSRRWPRA